MATEQRLIDANADVGNEVTKIKTHHARIIVEGTADKPYYSIEWYDPSKKVYYLGYSSYNIEFVFNWLSECFEIVDDPTVDAVVVVRCKDCKHWHEETGWCNQHSCFIEEDGEPCHPWESNNWKMLSADDFCSYGERRTDHV